VRSIRVFAKKTWAIPIMNPLLWFMIDIMQHSDFTYKFFNMLTYINKYI